MGEMTRDNISAVIDGLLKMIAAGGFVSVALVAPGALSALDKPIAQQLKRMDKRSRERELRRITYYMKQKGLIAYKTRDYEHGIKLTKAGKERLKRTSKAINIPHPAKWDKRWRLVFFDIPVEDNTKRKNLTRQLRQLGFVQLQKSIWVHPFPCRPEIEALCEKIGVRKYLTYIEVLEIDSDKKLQSRFKNTLNL